MEQTIIGAGGALLCVLVGHFLTRLWEEKRWKRDQKLLEFRELVTAITAAIADQQHYELAGGIKIDLFEKQMKSFKKAVRTIEDRIFILEDVKRLRIGERFFDGRNQFAEDQNGDAFAKNMGSILRDIVSEAQKI
ncbi:MAG TPA: hypothetical protein VND90_13775 [Terracidiphilus sp.]|nr:hypothetical protein [Terracidiphilus sp.]